MNALAALVCSLEVELMPTVRGARVSWQPDPPESRTAIIMPWPPSISQSAETAAIEEFARGLEGRVPSRTVVDMARRLVAAAISKTDEPEITVDVDGASAFDLRLNSGRLMFAELSIEGTLDLSVIDDSRQETFVICHASSATDSGFFDQL